VSDGKRGPALTEAQLFLILALLIGIFAGLSVVCFRIAIEWTRLWLLGSSLSLPAGRLLLVLPVAGLVIAALVELVFPQVRGSGVNQTKAAVYIYEGHIPFRTVIGKFITSALAIGSGQSLGPEDPSLQIGAGLASAFGRGAGLSRATLRLIAPVGAAAGLAAAFNSPITAVLFVIEEVIGTWSAAALGAIVLAAVSSVVVEQLFLGDLPLFRVPPYHLSQTPELLVYACLGLIGGVLAIVFVKLALYARPRMRALPRWTWYLQPAAAGLLVAIMAIWFPQITGAGYEYIDEAMHDQYVWHTLAVLAALKIIATVLSFSSGAPGGLFAPTLFIGAMLGGAVCGVTHLLWPGFTGSTGIYALIGMGTMFAGILRAPITSVFMIIEVSGNYSIVLPVMISNAIAYLVSRRYQPEAIFDELARMDGVRLPSMEQQRETVVQRVEDAMRPAPISIRPAERIRDAMATLPDGDGQALVEARPGTWTLVTGEMLQAFARDGKGDLAVGSVLGLATPLPLVHPDQPLDVALRRLGDRPFLPVVHRAESGRLVGIVAIQDILKAYKGKTS
jgi:chloride channel protein, CIC family